jgi:hypothetical protein
MWDVPDKGRPSSFAPQSSNPHEEDEGAHGIVSSSDSNGESDKDYAPEEAASEDEDCESDAKGGDGSAGAGQSNEAAGGGQRTE